MVLLHVSPFSRQSRLRRAIEGGLSLEPSQWSVVGARGGSTRM